MTYDEWQHIKSFGSLVISLELIDVRIGNHTILSAIWNK